MKQKQQAREKQKLKSQSADEKDERQVEMKQMYFSPNKGLLVLTKNKNKI